MITVAGVAVLCHLHHVETELGADVRLGVVGVSDAVAVLFLQFQKFDRDDLVDGRMAAVVGNVVRQGAK